MNPVNEVVKEFRMMGLCPVYCMKRAERQR